MPRGDNTGPMGMGPMTGRGAGYCAGYNAPGCANGLGLGFFGRGRRFLGNSGYNPFYYGKNSENISEKDVLTNQANALKQQLDDINKRLSQIDSDK